MPTIRKLTPADAPTVPPTGTAPTPTDQRFPRYPAYKDSGVEWLGQVPEHWMIAALKHIVSLPITDGPHETPEFLDEGIPLTDGPHETPEFLDEGILFLSAEAVKNGKLDFNLKRGYIAEDLHQIYAKKCQPIKDDIFMVKSGNTTGNLAIVEADEIFAIWSPLALIRCNKDKALPHYLYFFMHSQFFQTSVSLAASYGTQPNIGMGVIENLQVVFPPSPNNAPSPPSLTPRQRG